MRHQTILILLLVLGFTFNCNSQSKSDSLFFDGEKYIKAKKFDNAYLAFKNSIILYHQGKEWEKAQSALKYITKIPYDSARVEEFTVFIENQSDYLKEINPNESAFLHSYIGQLNARNGRFSEALQKYKDSSDKLYAINDTQYLHYVYYWLGQTYQYGQSNGVKTLEYANQAERIYNLKNETDSVFIGKTYNLKGIAYQSSDLNKAIENFRKAQELLGDPKGIKESYISKSLSNLERHEESYLSAVKATNKYFAATKKINGEYLANEAMILRNLNRNEEALDKINQALKYIDEIYYPNEPDFIKLYFYKAQILRRIGNFDLALTNIQTLFSSFYPEYKTRSNIDIPDISNVTPNPWVLYALELQGAILIDKYKESNDSKYLDLAITSFNKALDDLEVRRKEMESWSSKEQYNQILYYVYEQALISSAWLYQNDPSAKNKSLVLSLLKKSKATLLQENLTLKKEKENIPAAILDQEDEILQSISDLETKILKEQKGGNMIEAKSLENELFDTKQKLDEFKKKNSMYYSNSITSTVSLSHEQIVNDLPEVTSVMSYHIGEEDILSIGFNKDELHLRFTPKSSNFDGSVLKMRQMLSDWNSTLSNRSASEDSIKLYANNISDILLGPISDFNNSPEQIIIMPNGALHNIPFELLPIPGKDEVMIDKYDVSYAYLFSSFPSSEKSAKRSASFAGFAPKYNKERESIASEIEEETIEDSKLLALRSGLIDIPEARKNVSTLAAKYDGASWINEQATKENFVKEAKNYDVLHLGMHSLLNENTSSLSSLVFSGDANNELYLREVRSMDIPASLVVLSACNTGVGRNVVGEGPFSLARAFFYAGAESALMSLWQVPDVQTSRIMQLFYSNLEKGFDKSKALAQAKREYLKSASVLESHPAFWSGFVLVGDTSALDLGANQSFLTKNSKYLFIALLLGIVFFLGLRLRRSKV